MPSIELPIPRARNRLDVQQITSNVTELSLNIKGQTILFWKGDPVAVRLSGIVYFNHPAEGAITKAVKTFAGDCITVVAEAPNFDFLVGQILTSTGLPLTRKEG